MACCGSRTLPPASTMPTGYRVPPANVPAAPMTYRHAFFEYVGATAMTVTGGATGRRYRFERPGARVAVDPKDRASVAQVPQLREVYSP